MRIVECLSSNSSSNSIGQYLSRNQKKPLYFFFVIMRIAAECLSICAGNPSIRQAILEVEQHIMFVWLLQSEDYDIRVNGALALAKFAAIDKVRFVKSQSFF